MTDIPYSYKEVLVGLSGNYFELSILSSQLFCKKNYSKFFLKINQNRKVDNRISYTSCIGKTVNT